MKRPALDLTKGEEWHYRITPDDGWLMPYRVEVVRGWIRGPAKYALTLAGAHRKGQRMLAHRAHRELVLQQRWDRVLEARGYGRG